MKFVKYTSMEGFDFLPRQPEIERSPGLHVTSIIQDIMVSSGMMKDNGPFRANMYTESGFIFEDLIALVMKERTPNRPGEIELDGISMSPDGFDWEKWVLWEFKCTWTSSNKLPVDNWRWMSQIKAYCKGMDCLQCSLLVLHINGDYRGGGPQLIKYDIEFTPLEIQENWEMLVTHAKSKRWL